MASRRLKKTLSAAQSSAPPRRGPCVVVLATGGTIAGEADTATDNVAYVSGRRSVHDLLAAVPALRGQAVEAEQIAQVDSKDMSHALWSRLARRAAAHLARDEVAGLVVTHGTDTMEETGWLLHRVLAPWLQDKSLVLTAAMRPATSLLSDGPQNLLDAVTVASSPGVAGALFVLGGQVWAAAEARKVHPWRLDAFDAADAGPVALVREGRLTRLRDWPRDTGASAPRPDKLPDEDAGWPWVEIVVSHAGADGRAVRRLTGAAPAGRRAPAREGVQGLVVAGTGNGTVHEALAAALREARTAGVALLRATRCPGGGIVDAPAGEATGDLPSAGSLTPAQARVELMLNLLAARASR